MPARYIMYVQHSLGLLLQKYLHHHDVALVHVSCHSCCRRCHHVRVTCTCLRVPLSRLRAEHQLLNHVVL